MERVFTLNGATRRDPAVGAWLRSQDDELGPIARRWFAALRAGGDDVRERMHDGAATACVGVVAFAYVGVFTRHVNLGFFRGALLPDPLRLLEGTGKRMRHVKLRPGQAENAPGLAALIAAAVRDARRLAAG